MVGLVLTPAAAEPDPPAAAVDPAAVAEQVRALSAAESPEARRAAAAAVAEIGTPAIAELQRFLARERTSSEAERRAVLKAIKADVPDKKGRFRTPKRKEKVNRSDDFDWLEAMAGVGATLPGLAEVKDDVAAIRALAALRDPDAAAVLLDFGFSATGLIYRDECGRYLRRMDPYSLPALIVASVDRQRDRSARRYAGYQLDRLDREDPNKALAAARGDAPLELAVIRAYGQSKHRAAFAPLLALADAQSPGLRAAARTSLSAYVTGPEPRPAPKRKLVLPGGKLSDEEEPLWLNHRELAEVELRRAYQAAFDERPSRRMAPSELAKALFSHYDRTREARAETAYRDAEGQAQAGNWAEATARYDRILAQDPDHRKRPVAARWYYQHARGLAASSAWYEAAAAYSKAHGMAPEADFAEDALASHYYALGKGIEADGGDGAAAFRQADSATPDGATLSARGEAAAAQPEGQWMLYSGIAGGAGALILLILGLAVRWR